MDESPNTLSVQDPLSEVTRKERRSLLMFSGIGLFIDYASLVPTKISALGLDFDKTSQAMLKKGLAALVAFFLFAFIIYAWADFLAWRFRFEASVKKTREETHARQLKKEKEEKTRWDGVNMNDMHRVDEWELIEKSYVYRTKFLLNLSEPTAVVRALFEFVLPVIIGLCAVGILLHTAKPKPEPPPVPDSSVSHSPVAIKQPWLIHNVPEYARERPHCFLP